MRRVALLLLLAAVTSGCGLRPAYSGGSASPVASLLNGVTVQPLDGRTGWLLRSALVDRLGGEGGSRPYRLELDIEDDLSGFGIRGDQAVTRERRTVRARFRLVEVSSGQVLLDATAGSDAGIDVVDSEYATVAAEQSAAERLAQVVADQIIARLSLYASRRP